MTTVLMKMVARLLLLPSFVIAVAMLIHGYVNVGDGFSAGVVASSGVALQYIVFGWRETEARFRAWRFAPLLALLGLFIVLLIVFVPVALGDPLLTHYPRAYLHVRHLGSIEFLTAALFDVGVFLLVFGFVVTTISLIAHSAERSHP
jgi:multisubunit Na+/H+ antiporter MnhB subunit